MENKSLLTILSNGKSSKTKLGTDSLVYKGISRLTKDIIKIKPLKASLISISIKTFEPRFARD